MEKKKQRKRKKKSIGRFLLLVIAIILSYIFVFKTDVFIVSEIIVEGNKKLKADTIVKASTCNIGENIFRIDIDNGENNLKLIPYVKDSKIKRQLPDKVIIEVEERKEVAVVDYMDYVVYIDKEGYILEIDRDKKEVELPKISGLDMVHFEEGSNIYQDNSMEKLEEFITYSEASKLLSLIDEIDVSNYDSINIQLNNGTLVEFGPLNNVKYKLSFIIEILQDIESKNMEARKIMFNKGENPIIVIDNR